MYAFKSGNLISAISFNCAEVILPTTSAEPFADPDLTLATFFSKNAVGGVKNLSSKLLSS